MLHKEPACGQLGRDRADRRVVWHAITFDLNGDIAHYVPIPNGQSSI